MEKGLRAKFTQNPQAAEMLKATGNAVLIKSCPVCYKCGFGIGSGQNCMGKILMQIREELQTSTALLLENSCYSQVNRDF